MGVTSSKSRQLEQLFREQEKQQAARVKAAALAAAGIDKTMSRTPRNDAASPAPPQIDYKRLCPSSLSSLDHKKRKRRKQRSPSLCVDCVRKGKTSIKQTIPTREVEVCGVRFVSMADQRRAQLEAASARAEEAEAEAAVDRSIVAAVEASHVSARDVEELARDEYAGQAWRPLKEDGRRSPERPLWELRPDPLGLRGAPLGDASGRIVPLAPLRRLPPMTAAPISNLAVAPVLPLRGPGPRPTVAALA